MDRFSLAKLLLPLYPIACVVLAAALAGTAGSCGRQDLPALSTSEPRAILREIPQGPAPTIRVRLFAGPVRQATISASHGAVLKAGGVDLFRSEQSMSPVTLRRGPTGWLVGSRSIEAMSLTFEALDGHVRVQRPARQGRTWRSYRGTLQLLPVGTDSFAVVNHVSLEGYLLGVLAEEMYGSWEIEAFRAQAIAARTHAWHRALTYGKENYYDVNDNVSSQMYGGISAETEKARQAVIRTWGQVLTYPLEGRPHLFLAQYSSSCGGRVNGAQVLREVREIPPLSGGQVCTHCNLPANKRYRWEPVRINKSRIFLALLLRDRAYYDPLGDVDRITVQRRTSYGRAVWLRIHGSSGPNRAIRAEDLRLILLRHLSEAKELYSMNCTIRDEGSYVVFENGRGWGHGVGMCQWGAHGMARLGRSAREILALYYPGARIHEAYGGSPAL